MDRCQFPFGCLCPVCGPLEPVTVFVACLERHIPLELCPYCAGMVLMAQTESAAKRPQAPWVKGLEA